MRLKAIDKAILFLFIIITINSYSQVPSSQRSIQAIENKTTQLTKDMSDKGLTLGSPIFIRIFKSEHELELWVRNAERYELFRTYSICYYSGSLGPKTMQGDNQSPEGFYFVTERQMNPWSNYHLSINIGYPNRYDRMKGYTGNYLMIHGNCVSIGCYAMTDSVIEELFTIAVKALEGGQDFFRVHIFPFRMSEENMDLNGENDWYPFWENLKAGYDLFERNRIPPNVEVENGRYVFN